LTFDWQIAEPAKFRRPVAELQSGTDLEMIATLSRKRRFSPDTSFLKDQRFEISSPPITYGRGRHFKQFRKIPAALHNELRG
jgi:hypothetical protein